MRLTKLEREQIASQREARQVRDQRLDNARRDISECLAKLPDRDVLELAGDLMRKRKLREDSERYWASVKDKRCEGKRCSELADQDTMPVKYCSSCWERYGID